MLFFFTAGCSWDGRGLLVIAQINRIRLNVNTLRTLKATDITAPRQAILRLVKGEF